MDMFPTCSTHLRPGGRHRMGRLEIRPRESKSSGMEPLENRLLLAAGDFDPTFGGGDGGATVDLAVSGNNTDFAAAMAVPSAGKIILARTNGNRSKPNDRIPLAAPN